jgi:hypothetical protein
MCPLSSKRYFLEKLERARSIEHISLLFGVVETEVPEFMSVVTKLGLDFPIHQLSF